MWIHVLPGRARARVAGLKGSPRMGALLVERLNGCPGIRSVAASAATGTVLVYHDLELRDLEYLLRVAAAASPAPPARPASPAPPASPTIPVNRREAATVAYLAAPPTVPVNSPPAGLTTHEVEHRRAAVGRNELREPPRPSFLRRLAAQYRDAMQLVLLGGAGLSFLAGHRTDALTMAAVLLLNGIVGATQSGGTPRAFQALKAMGDRPARVVRDGLDQIVPAADLVPGDLLLLESGDRVPADAAVAAATGLALDESHLTGECTAVAKEEPGAPLPAGSLVVRGRGIATVTATGMDSSLGRIAGLLEGAERPSPLQREMDGLGRRMARVGLWLAAGVTGLSLLRGQGVLTGLLSGVSLAISAVPEGLPAFVTLALAAGARRTAAENGQFQNLPAVETMGAVTVLCCDKTGTLTRGEMAVREVYLDGDTWAISGAGYCPEGEFRRNGRAADPLGDPGLKRLLKVAALCTNAGLGLDPEGQLVTRGDPTEVALLVAALKAGLRAAGGEGERLRELPFDAERRRMSVVCGDGTGRAVVCTKGAPEAVLPFCVLDGRVRRRLDRTAASMAARGLRVLAVACRAAPADLSRTEQELTFLGLVGMDDPPRPEAAPTVQKCREAGQRIIMITGDHPATARTIANQVGIQGDLLTGDQLACMTDAELQKAAPGLGIVARAAPDQKLRVIRALRAGGHVVAMTGDGVNDGPAMREADIGIAMGDRGTEVARATAGLVLEDDSLATVVSAVQHGRATRTNIGRMARYLLGSNAAEVCLTGASLVLGLPLPLLPAQLLFMNLAGDGLPASALGAEPPGPHPGRAPTVPVNSHLFGHGLRTGLAATALYGLALAAGRPLPAARSLAMVTLVAAQVRQLAASPSRTVRRAGAATAALTLAAVYIPPLRGALGLAPLGPGALTAAALTAAAAVPPRAP